MSEQDMAEALAQMNVATARGLCAMLHELKRAKALDNAAIARVGDFMLASLPGLDEGHPTIRAYRESLLDRLEEALRTPYE